VPATKTRHVSQLPAIAPPPLATADAAVMVFEALGELHGLAQHDAELLRRAVAGLRFIQSMGAYTDLEHELFEVALSELDPRDAFVVEASACYAADTCVATDPLWRSGSLAEKRRAMWFAAIVRLCDPLCSHGASAPDDVYAAWTADSLYLEFDGSSLCDAQLSRASARVAALEAVTGRTVLLASSTARRGVA
jgi:hypothetical protein